MNNYISIFINYFFCFFFLHMMISHSADGISMRHPRVLRNRPDKSWDTATSLAELKELVKNSGGGLKAAKDDEDDDEDDGFGAAAAAASPARASSPARAPKRATLAVPRARAKPAKRKRAADDRSDDEDDDGSDLADFIVDDDDDDDDGDDDDDDDGRSDYGSLSRGRRPAKRARLAGRPPCRFGAKCYRQKNADHTREYAHPGDADYAAGGGDEEDGAAMTVDDDDDRPAAAAAPPRAAAATAAAAPAPSSTFSGAIDLPDIFRSCWVFVPKALPDAEQLKR